MKKSIIYSFTTILLVLIYLMMPFCITNVEAQAVPKENRTDRLQPEFIQKAQKIIDNYRQNTGAPGVAVGIYENGKSYVLVSGNTGDKQQSPVTGETIFAMGSVEKVFNSILLAFSLNENKAKLDDPAADYITAENGITVNNKAPFRKITLKELVTHTSALPRRLPHTSFRIGTNLFRDHPMKPMVIQFLNSWHPQYAPGSKYVYSNLGFALVGFAAVNLGGKSYTRLLAKNITEPLGMTHTGMFCEPYSNGCAVGYTEDNGTPKTTPVGLWTTVDDMLRFIQANLGDLKPSDKLFKAIEKTHKELFRVDNDHAIGMAWEEWHQGDSLLISKDGLDSGFSSWVGFEPAKDRGVVVLRNGGKTPEPGKLGKRLLSLVN